MPFITLWIPAAEQPQWACVFSWLGMQVPPGYQMRFVRSEANNPKYSWNKVVRDFLARPDDEWLFSVHNDVMFPPPTLPRLMSWDKPLVGALLFMRRSPVIPHVWWWAEEDETRHLHRPRLQEMRVWFAEHPEAVTFEPRVLEPRPADALIEVSFTSTSCLLIHRKVLEAIGDNWFQWDDDFRGAGEDRRFFELARAAGFIGYVDRSCIVGSGRR